MNIGFIGTGLMGSRIVARMLANNYKVMIFNRSKEKTLPLVEQGAILADSVISLSRSSDIVFTMISDVSAVEKVALGPAGFLSSMKKGSLWVDVSTIGPSASKLFAALAFQENVSFMDSPVSGSTRAAEHGELISLVGGSPHDLDRARPLLETYSKKIIHAGGVGSGSALKLVVNLALCQSMAAFSELLVFANELELPRHLVFDTLVGGIAIPPFIAFKRGKLENHEYSAEFPLRHMAKDARLIAKEAQGGHTEGLGLTEEAIHLFNSIETKEYEDFDFSAIAEVVAQRRIAKDIE